MLKKDDIYRQSTAAWNIWRTKWIDNCAVTKTLDKQSMATLLNACEGKLLVQCAFGYSLNHNLPAIRAYRDQLSVMCCDKAFGYLMENEIVPDYCIIADASVDTEWIKGQDTSKTTLIANVAANPEWTKNWKGPRVFYLNWDNIGTANILGAASDVWEVIPASSNVSNAQVVFATQVLNPSKQLLVGYDYSWMEGGWYYASKDSDKRHYMHHADVVSPFGYLARSSSNLIFSRNWLMQFIQKFKYGHRIINCSGMGLMELESQMPLGEAVIRYVPKSKEEFKWQ